MYVDAYWSGIIFYMKKCNDPWAQYYCSDTTSYYELEFMDDVLWFCRAKGKKRMSFIQKKCKKTPTTCIKYVMSYTYV